MTSNQLQNAQRALNKRRRRSDMVPVADILNEFDATAVWLPQSDPVVRTYQLTPLHEFTFNHLETDDQRQRLQYALKKADTWLKAYASTPGLSFVLAGPVGTGKTTIAENLMQSFCRNRPIPADDEYISLLLAALEKMPEHDPKREQLQMLVDVESAGSGVNTIDGRLVEATALMRMLADETPLSCSFGRYPVIVVDDTGTEEIAYANERTETVKRQRRYGRFFDYCYRNHKHLIITSMTPMLDGDQLNSEFVDIFGAKAFDRLYQMSKGYMCDLSGLPSYRPYAVGGVV